MSAAIVVEGTEGRAVRRDLRTSLPQHRESIVDDWTITTRDRGEWSMVTGHHEGVYALMVAQVNPLLALLSALFRRRDSWGVRIALAVPLPCPVSREHAREITRELARVVVAGGLPLPPREPGDRAMWRLMAGLMAAGTLPIRQDQG